MGNSESVSTIKKNSAKDAHREQVLKQTRQASTGAVSSSSYRALQENAYREQVSMPTRQANTAAVSSLSSHAVPASYPAAPRTRQANTGAVSSSSSHAVPALFPAAPLTRQVNTGAVSSLSSHAVPTSFPTAPPTRQANTGAVSSSSSHAVPASFPTAPPTMQSNTGAVSSSSSHAVPASLSAAPLCTAPSIPPRPRAKTFLLPHEIAVSPSPSPPVVPISSTPVVPTATPLVPTLPPSAASVVPPCALPISAPAIMKSDGSLSANWCQWKQNFQIYLSALGLDGNDERTCSIFLHTIGQYGRDIFNSLEIEKPYSIQQFFTTFDKHCKPKTNLFLNRHLFFTTIQNGDQPFESFLETLKKKASTCEFGKLYNELLVVQIISGVNNISLKERLLNIPRLTVADAIEECRSEFGLPGTHSDNANNFAHPTSKQYYRRSAPRQNNRDERPGRQRSHGRKRRGMISKPPYEPRSSRVPNQIPDEQLNNSAFHVEKAASIFQTDSKNIYKGDFDEIKKCNLDKQTNDLLNTQGPKFHPQDGGVSQGYENRKLEQVSNFNNINSERASPGIPLFKSAFNDYTHQVLQKNDNLQSTVISNVHVQHNEWSSGNAINNSCSQKYFDFQKLVTRPPPMPSCKVPDNINFGLNNFKRNESPWQVVNQRTGNVQSTTVPNCLICNMPHILENCPYERKQEGRKNDVWNCNYCGMSHQRHSCPAHGKKCAKCGKYNHFANVCKNFLNEF